MELSKELRDILKNQTQELKRMEAEIRSLEARDFIAQNNDLQQKLAATEAEKRELQEKLAYLKEENGNMKAVLNSQMAAEKLALLNLSKKALYQRYADFETAEHLRISNIEKIAHNKIGGMIKALAETDPAGQALYQEKIAAAEEALNNYLTQRKKELAVTEETVRTTLDRTYEPAVKEPISSETIRKKAVRDNAEYKLGGRITNILGVLLILLGVVFGLQYTYTHFLTTGALKSAAAFALGALFLGTGEFLNSRKEGRNPFSTGITAGGVAILYAATAMSYFFLGVMGMMAALTVCILITAAAFFLSVRYKAQTIANFAIIGGYLPILTAFQGGFAGTLAYSLMAYFALLNALALLVAAKRDWHSIKYTGFIMNTLCMVLLLGFSRAMPIPLLIFVSFNFLMVVFIAAIGPIREKKPISNSALGIIVLNTLCHCSFTYFILLASRMGRFAGIAAVGLSLFYFLLSRYLQRTYEQTRTSDFFLLSALALALIVVPLQLSPAYISLGWVAEGAALVIFGVWRKDGLFKKIGFVAYGLCFFMFLAWDLRYAAALEFLIRHTAITLAAAGILAALTWERKDDPLFPHQPQGAYLRIFQYCVYALGYWYLLALMNYLLGLSQLTGYYFAWFWCVGLALISLAYPWGLHKVPLLDKKGFTPFAGILTTLGVLGALAVNIFDVYYLSNLGIFFYGIFALVTAAALLGLVRFFTLAETAGKASPRAKGLAACIYILITTTQVLLFQQDLYFTDMAVSITYIFLALAFILAGFRLRNAGVRRIGLVLEMAAVIKFFLLDLAFLAQVERILSYFVLGGVLIGISYVYQYFTKKITPVKAEEEKDA